MFSFLSIFEDHENPVIDLLAAISPIIILGCTIIGMFTN